MSPEQRQKTHAQEMREVRQKQKATVSEQLGKGLETLSGVSVNQVRRALRTANRQADDAIARIQINVEQQQRPVFPKPAEEIQSTSIEFERKGLGFGDSGDPRGVQQPQSPLTEQLRVRTYVENELTGASSVQTVIIRGEVV